MNIEEVVAEGKGEGTVDEGKTRPVEPEEKYNHLLYLCLNKCEGQAKQLIVETIKKIGGEGDIVKGSDGEEYRAWDTMKEEDFGNVLFNLIMNMSVIYNKLCSGKEDDTIGELFAIPKKV
jgi:hypothetical protein